VAAAQRRLRRAGGGGGRRCAPARCATRNADLVGDVLGQLAQTVGHADLGLGDEVHRTQLQRRSVTSAPRSVSVDTITTGIGPQAHQLAQEVDAVHARHLDVQRDHVGVQLADHLARHVGVGRSRPTHSMSGCG
jgi:hypothetical protein